MKFYISLMIFCFMAICLDAESIPKGIDIWQNSFEDLNCDIALGLRNPNCFQYIIVSNPVKHFLDYNNHINKNHNLLTTIGFSKLNCYDPAQIFEVVLPNINTLEHIMIFKTDVNNDSKPDLFITSNSGHLLNGQQGNIYFVYLSDNDRYLWDDDNNITLNYKNLIFNNKSTQGIAPLILIEEDSIWACAYPNNQKTEYKILDMKWSKHHSSSDIFHDILNRTGSKDHPLY